MFKRLKIWIKRAHEVISDWILLFRYRRRPYIEYYRAVMKRETAADPRYAVGGRWEVVGPMQFERLLRYGLKPNHTLFDLGCGSLRGGLHFIKYLEAGKYTGTDISPEILAAGKQFLHQASLEAKNPRLLLASGLDFCEVEGEKFDYIHAQSVLSHMPPEDIDQLFQNVRKIMHSGTQFLASFFLAKGEEIYPENQKRNFFFPLAWMQETGARHGLKVEMVETDQKQKLMRITLS